MFNMKYNKPFSKSIDISSDDRGTFVPFLKDAHSLPEKKGLAIKRIYYVYNYGKGVVRGFHFHEHEWKYFIISSGAAKFVALNPDKPDKKFIFISSARKPNLVVIPPGYANGWVSLEENTVLLCGSTSSLEESIKDDKRYDPYSWGDVWTVAGR
jgi:dTDP-4-dehydrorhamnose 3,5-epimerase-like enzyme